MTSSFQIRICILSKEVGYLFFEFEQTRRKVACHINSWQICKQAIIKLLLAYNFLKIFFSLIQI